MSKKIASLYAEISADTTKLQRGLKDSKGKLSDFKGSLNNTVKELTGFNLSSIGAAGAVMAVGNAIKKSVTDWSNYAESIQKSAANAGVSTEEMSRLVQASDDFRVSQEALQGAMVMALKNGFEPSIENLAKLSDEYRAIEKPSERAAFASKIFGRSYAEITPLLLQGGDAIRSGTAAIADNLIVTEKAVAQNKEYIKAIDDWEDAWAGASHTVAQEALPVITDAIEGFNNKENLWQFIKRLREETKLAEAAYRTAAPAGKDMNEMLRGTAQVAPGATDAINAAADATNNAAEAMREYTKELLFKIASEGLSAEESLSLAYAMGLVDTATVTATEKARGYREMLDSGKITIATYNALIEGLASRIAALQDKDVKVTVSTYENTYQNTYPGNHYNPGNNTTVTPMASGGAVTQVAPYLVGEVGPEMFVPKSAGDIVSSDDLRKLFGEMGGVKVEFTGPISSDVDVEVVANRVATIIEERRR